MIALSSLRRRGASPDFCGGELPPCQCLVVGISGELDGHPAHMERTLSRGTECCNDRIGVNDNPNLVPGEFRRVASRTCPCRAGSSPEPDVDGPDAFGCVGSMGRPQGILRAACLLDPRQVRRWVHNGQVFSLSAQWKAPATRSQRIGPAVIGLVGRIGLLDLARQWLRPTRQHALLLNRCVPANGPSTEGRGPPYVPVTRIWRLALGFSSAEHVVTVKLDASAQSFRPQACYWTPKGTHRPTGVRRRIAGCSRLCRHWPPRSGRWLLVVNQLAADTLTRPSERIAVSAMFRSNCTEVLSSSGRGVSRLEREPMPQPTIGKLTATAAAKARAFVTAATHGSLVRR